MLKSVAFPPAVDGAISRPAPARLRGMLLTVCLGEALVQLGATPATSVLPALAAAVGVGTAHGAWILTSYLLALAGTLLVAGRLGDLLGHGRMFGLGALVYAAATVVAGLATSFELLLVARGAQGLGAAMVAGNNLAILAHAVPEQHRAKAIAGVAAASSAAAVLGAVAGTAVIALGGWQLIFVGTTPLALWAAARARRLPGSEPGPARTSVDWAGAGLLVLTITLLAVALNHPHTGASEASMTVYHAWLPALGILAAGSFVAVERRVRVPLLEWGRLRNGPFAAAVGVNLLLHLTMLAAIFLGPVLVVGLGMDTAAGGMLMVVVQVSAVAGALSGGWLYDRTRSAWIRPGGAATLSLGLLVWASMALSGSYVGLVVAGLIGGFGTGLLMAVNNTIIMGSLPASARGVASGMLETTRHFGHAFGVTIPTAFLALAAASAPGTEGEVLRQGSAWACFAMAGLAVLGIGLATVRPFDKLNTNGSMNRRTVE